MEQLGYPILSTTIFLPIAGALLLLLMKGASDGVVKYLALAISTATFAVSLPLFFMFDKAKVAFQFMEKHPWIPSFNINYSLGVDGISVLFVLLSTLITLLCVLVSWDSIRRNVKEFYIALLLVEGSMIGVFCAMDFILFYVFWEAMLIPMFLLIGIWGGPNRVYAAIKFFLFTLVGSLLMLVGIIYLYQTSGNTFDILSLSYTGLPYKAQFWLFWAFFSAFAVKVPMFPVHTWLPDAHTEAPTAGSVILAGILIKMGAYGFLRFSIPMFPQAAVAMTPIMLTLSVIAIIYGGVVCLAQTDLKRLIAYSSVSHMGFVTLGIFALNVQGLEGGILQMINHGIITGALFLSIGMIYDQTHTRQIKDYGGLASVVPIYSAFFLIFTLASIGFPSMNGFIGEFLILVGGFAAKKWAGVLAATGIIIGAGYMLWLYQRMFYMETAPKMAGLADLNGRELLTLLPMVILIFWIGLYPNTFLGFMHVSVADMVSKVTGAAPSGMEFSNMAEAVQTVLK